MVDIILLSGKQGAGKTAIGLQLEAQCKLFGFQSVQRMKFADIIYELHDAILDLMEQRTGIPRVKKDGDLLQYLGTDWGRNKFGADIWANCLKRAVQVFSDAHYSTYRHQKNARLMILVDDCRFENEFNTFPEALRVRLNAAEDIRKARAESWRENTLHSSEVSLDLYDIEGRFDLYFQTDMKATAADCARDIMTTLLKNNWKDSRNDLAR